MRQFGESGTEGLKNTLDDYDMDDAVSLASLDSDEVKDEIFDFQSIWDKGDDLDAEGCSLCRIEVGWQEVHPPEIIYLWTYTNGLRISNHEIFRLWDIDSKISNLRLRFQMREWLKEKKIEPFEPPKDC